MGVNFTVTVVSIKYTSGLYLLTVVFYGLELDGTHVHPSYLSLIEDALKG